VKKIGLHVCNAFFIPAGLMVDTLKIGFSRRIIGTQCEDFRLAEDHQNTIG
jgi:hypothetical protein